MEKMLITGAGGFIGANLVRHFANKYELHILVKESTNLWRLQDFISTIHIHYGDITNTDDLQRIFSEISPTYIIHTAAYGIYPDQKDEEQMIKVNFLGTVNLLRAYSSFKAFINTGSYLEYGKNDHFTEDTAPEPLTSYGAAKAAATIYCQQIAREKHLPIMTLRLFTPFGYLEDDRRLIPSIVKASLANKAPQLSSPDNIRDFVFIEDVMNAYEQAIKNPHYGAIWNVCTGVERSVADVVVAVQGHIPDAPAPVYGTQEKRAFETAKVTGSNTKISTEIGWKPRYTLEQGIRKIIDFQRTLQTR